MRLISKPRRIVTEIAPGWSGRAYWADVIIDSEDASLELGHQYSALLINGLHIVGVFPLEMVPRSPLHSKRDCYRCAVNFVEEVGK
jgi:hypothetical protein